MITKRTIARFGEIGILRLLLPAGGGAGCRGLRFIFSFFHFFILLLFSCSEPVVVPEVPQEVVEQELPLELSTSVSALTEVAPASRGTTRSFVWDPPTKDDGYISDFFLYNNLFTGDVYFTDLATQTVDLFFAQETDDIVTGSPLHSPLHGRLGYSRTKDMWSFITLDEDSPSTGDYFAYGFTPLHAAKGEAIRLLTDSDLPPAYQTPSHTYTYSDGAVLTINGMQTVGKDVCVIVGAKEGFRVETSAGNGTDYDGGWDDKAGGTVDKYDDGIDTRKNRVRPGDFRFYLKESTKENPYTNYLFLLFDHLCSSLGISMQVNHVYDALRTIKVTELRMQTYTDDSPTTPNKKRTNVTITLRAKDTGDMPIIDVSYSPDLTSGDDTDGTTFFKNTDGVALGLDPKTFMGNFVPVGVTKLRLTSTFDVYDKKGNLVRKGSTATNTIQLKTKGDVMGVYGDRFTGCERGKKYIINLTINPTYLYVMSDPDLENPTVVVN